LRDAARRTKRLVHVKLGDAGKLLIHDEPIWRGDTIVGSITSGMYGHRIEASLGMGYVKHADGVTAEWLAAGGFAVEVAWERVPATLQFAPWYDPRGERIRS
jgi:4-methylaminobutanoate oxidase (formaldehyde-forming)